MSDQLPEGIASAFARKGEQRAANCPEHGAYTAVNIIRGIWSKCPVCEVERRAAAEAEDAARQRRIADEQHRALLASAAIPQRFIGRTFDNFATPTERHAHALTVCRDYAESFAEQRRKGAGLILAGLPGTGKSHLAAALLQRTLSASVAYTTCLDMIRAVRDTWRRDSERSETQVLNHLERLDLLVIDEVGMQYGTDGEQTILFDVLDRRYRDMMPTIFLTNQDVKGMQQYIGERTFDRLREVSKWVTFDWPSHRPTARREAA